MRAEPSAYDGPGHSIGDVLDGLMHNVRARAQGIDPIAAHPGHSRDILSRGRVRFETHVSRVFDRNPSDDERAELAALYDRGQKLCESPIERNLLAALVTGDWPMCRQVLPAVHNAKNYDEAFPLNEVVIIPQMTILRFRSDIGLVVGPMNRRPVIVGLECDGKEFHQDGERDRQRDSYFRALGVPVIRISGAALNIEPIAVADGIIETVTRWASE